MNAATTFARIWTVFITALVKCLAVLGLKANPEAPVPAPVEALVPAPVPAQAASAASVLPSLTALLPRQRPGDLSVPPTMKQRIRAEAHGSSPTSRSRILSGRDRDTAPSAPTAPAAPVPAAPVPADLCLV
jgi:hypothetical protein